MSFFKIIPTSSCGILVTFGKFTRVLKPGLNFMIPFVQKIQVVSNRIQQTKLFVNTKTKDNVFIELHLDVQYKVQVADTEKAFYSLTNPIDQINSYVENIVRSHVPNKNFDQVFESSLDVSNTVENELSEKMINFGYTIENTLITNITPPASVVHAMNKVYEAKKLREASVEESNALYIKTIREAEATRDKDKLLGQGIAEKRKAIFEGFSTSVEDTSKKLNISPDRVLEATIRLQHLDMIGSVGKSNNTKVVFMNHDMPNFSKDIITSNLATEESSCV